LSRPASITARQSTPTIKNIGSDKQNSCQRQSKATIISTKRGRKIHPDRRSLPIQIVALQAASAAAKPSGRYCRRAGRSPTRRPFISVAAGWRAAAAGCRAGRLLKSPDAGDRGRLAAPLIRITRQPNFGLILSGFSAEERAVALMVASSVAGIGADPGLEAGRSWRHDNHIVREEWNGENRGKYKAMSQEHRNLPIGQHGHDSDCFRLQFKPLPRGAVPVPSVQNDANRSPLA
jgi:hypothetical protein